MAKELKIGLGDIHKWRKRKRGFVVQVHNVQGGRSYTFQTKSYQLMCSRYQRKTPKIQIFKDFG